MNRVIKQPDYVVEDMLRGIVAAHPALALDADNQRVIGVAHPEPGKVGVVTGGGARPDPACVGDKGPALGAQGAIGHIFSTP
ncbi:dihydroxyacetone kinase, partial [Burkholderia pseudomallei]